MPPGVLLLLVVPPLSGCFGGGGPLTADAPPQWSGGDWFEYEVADGNGTFRTTFVVQPGATMRERHFDHLFVPRPSYDSPFMHLDDNLAPIGPEWADLLTFPLTDGAQYEAVVDGESVTLLAGVDEFELPDGDEIGVFTIAGGRAVLAYAPEAGAFATVSVYDDGDDVPREHWRLLDWGHGFAWGGPVPWTPGDWWEFDADTWVLSGRLRLVHTAELAERSEFATNPVMLAEPVDASDLVLATPFLKIDPRTMHPRSGNYSTLLPKTYDFPLYDGDNWTSVSKNVPFRGRAEYDPHIPFAGGSAYGFRITDFTATTTFGRYTYVPAVKWFTDLQLVDLTNDQTVFEWHLTEFGSGYKGPIERADRRELANGTIDPDSAGTGVEIGPDAEIVDVVVQFIFAADGPPPKVTVLGPDGSERMRMSPTPCDRPRCFVPDEQTATAEPGTWTVRGDAPAGSLVTYSVRTITFRTDEVDFSDA